MAIFKEIEKRLENLFEGFFNNQFRSALQPVELARKLVAEMDRKRQISVTVTYAPNVFEVGLASEDLAEIERFKEALLQELFNYLNAHAIEKNYRLTGALDISLAADQRLKSGDCRVEAHVEEGAPEMTAGDHTQIISAEEARLLVDASPRAWLHDEARDLTFPLTSPSITIGRQGGNDIVLNSPSVSRHHARLDFAQTTCHLTDLDSTNGTYVNDKDISGALLADGDRLAFGDIVLVFRLSRD